MGYWLGAALVGLIGLMIWAVVADGKAMEEKYAAFMASCLEERKPYDCQLQWDTFAAAHRAEINAAIAAGNSAAAAARR